MQRNIGLTIVFLVLALLIGCNTPSGESAGLRKGISDAAVTNVAKAYIKKSGCVAAISSVTSYLDAERREPIKEVVIFWIANENGTKYSFPVPMTILLIDDKGNIIHEDHTM